MNLEELKQKQKEIEEKMQNEFINKLYNDIEHLINKAIRKDYQPTVHEKEVLNKIHCMINDLVKWF